MIKTLGSSLRALFLSIIDRINDFHRPLFNGAFVIYVLICYVEHLNLSDAAASIVEGVGDLFKLPLLALFFVLLLANGRESWKRLLVSIVLVSLSGITWIIGGSSRLFWAVLVVLSAGKVRMRDVSRLVLVASLLVTGAALVLWATGIAGDAVEASSATRERLSLGFGHPNTLGLMLFTICTSFAMFRDDRAPVFQSLVCAACAAATYIIPNSRTFALALVAWPVLLWGLFLTKSRPRARFSLVALLGVGALVVIVESLLSMVLFDGNNELWTNLDRLLSGRLWYQNYYYYLHPVSLFGHEFTEFGTMVISGKESFFVVDNVFCHIYLRFGLVGTAIVLISLFSLTKKALHEGYFGIMVAGLFFFALLGAVEGCFMLVAHNQFLFSFSALASGERLDVLDDCGPLKKEAFE